VASSNRGARSWVLLALRCCCRRRPRQAVWQPASCLAGETLRPFSKFCVFPLVGPEFPAGPDSLLGPAGRLIPGSAWLILATWLPRSLVLAGNAGKGAGYQHPPAVAGGHRRDDLEDTGAPERSWQ
jgi:hypothetical protein